MREVVRGFLSGQSGSAKGERQSGQNKKDGHSGEEIRGVMTLNEVSAKTSVPKDYILKSLGAPANTDARKPIRDWIHDMGKTMQDVRDAVAAYRSGKR